MTDSLRVGPTAAEVAFVNATALLKRRFEVDLEAPGMKPSGEALAGQDRLLRIEFDDAVSRGTANRDLARTFFAELEERGWSLPVAALLLNSTFFVSAMAAIPEARQTCARALLGPSLSQTQAGSDLGLFE